MTSTPTVGGPIPVVPPPADAGAGAPTLRVEFCGTYTAVPVDRPFAIGRDADLVIDENPYLHRRFLELSWHGWWWLANVGSLMAATVTDADGRVQAWLGPGARLPIVFGLTTVRFTAERTSYELGLVLDEPPLAVIESTTAHADGTTTIGQLTLTLDQRLLILALAEPALRERSSVPYSLPSSAEASRRLGWTLTKFNRKLDNVCQKLTKAGIQGLHGGPDRLASGRRARLVEYALAVRLVAPDDLPVLDDPAVATLADRHG